MKIIKSSINCFAILLAACLILSGCTSMNGPTPDAGDAGNAPKGISKNEPYFPTNFSDFEVPGELKIDRDNTLFINTSSFTGGVINFVGKIEVDSLTDFFINSMQKNGWRMTGEVRYKNILLAFTKPSKNCMITIFEGDYVAKTKVYVYITEDIAGKQVSQDIKY